MAKRKTKPRRGGLFTILKILLAFGLAGLVLAVFVLCERFVGSSKEDKTGPLVFEQVPRWVDQALLNQVYAAVGGSRTFQLEENMASRVVEGLKPVAWLHDIRARVTYRDIRVTAQWRKPLAQIESGSTAFHVDTEGVVLDPIELELPIVKIRGLRIRPKPAAGTVLEREDLSAAIGLIALLDRMDKRLCPNEPLLAEIDGIDMANFQGRRNRSKPHIVLTTKDDTPIHWGAELGAWGKYLEQSDEKKLAALYTFYKDCGTLLGGEAKYINLRDSRHEIPRP